MKLSRTLSNPFIQSGFNFKWIIYWCVTKLKVYIVLSWCRIGFIVAVLVLYCYCYSASSCGSITLICFTCWNTYTSYLWPVAFDPLPVTRELRFRPADRTWLRDSDNLENTQTSLWIHRPKRTRKESEQFNGTKGENLVNPLINDNRSLFWNEKE